MRRNPEDKRAAESSLARRALSLTRARHIDGDLRELVTVVNYSATVEHLVLELGLGVDMADIFEVRGHTRPARGTLRPIVLDGDRATFAYDGLDGMQRTTTVVAADARLEPVVDPEGWPGASVLATWSLSLEPGARQTIGWHVAASGDDDGASAVGDGTATSRLTHHRSPEPAGERPFDAPRIQSDHELLDRTLVRSLADLAALRNDGPGEGESYLAAGIPWFATLFGRDSLIAALETVAFMPELAKSTLEVLARLQATRDDPWHDAEPGKILHEMRAGEMARAGETPHDAYYGSVDATPLWLILLAETHAWTGDDALLERLWPHALAALAWIEDSGDLDGDGFVEYQRRSQARPPQPGLEGFGRLRPPPRRPARRGSDRPGRGAGLRLRRLPVDGAARPPSRRPGAGRPARCRGDDPAVPVRGRLLDARCALLRDGARRTRSDRWRASPRTRARRCGPGSSRPSAPLIVAERLLAPDMFSGWGDPDLRRGPGRATTRSAITRAPSGRTTTRSSRPASRRAARPMGRTWSPAG